MSRDHNTCYILAQDCEVVYHVEANRLPWEFNTPGMPSGYGQQLGLFAPRFKAAGYDIIISSFAGLAGAPLQWDGITIMPAGQDAYGSDVIPAHHYHAQADLVITLMDVWALQAHQLKNVPMACWMPIDTHVLGDGDRIFLDITEAIPIAMSRHGERLLRDAGYAPLYVPHGVDTSVFQPRADRDELREQAGLTGKFTIGILAANKDAIRKSFFPQFEAFARFKRDYCPEAHLLVHSLITSPGALDLKRIAIACGIEDSVTFSSQYKMLMGLFQPADIAAWLSMCDVLSNTAMGEGFGLTPLEALACGVPTIVTDCSAMTELALGPEWLVRGEDFWNPTHAARWKVPYIDHRCLQCGAGEGIVDRYCFAYHELTTGNREKWSALAVEKASQYDVNVVMSDHWRPAMTKIDRYLTARQEERAQAQAQADAEAVAATVTAE